MSVNKYSTFYPDSKVPAERIDAFLSSAGRRPGGVPREGGNRAPVACLQAHIASHRAVLLSWKRGRLLKVDRLLGAKDATGGGKRGRVTSFTRSARRRMMYELAKLDREILPVYVVLTFPDEYYPRNKSGIEFRRIWSMFRDRFKRRFPGMCAIHRREHEKRKSGLYVGEFFPHMNVLVWGVSEIELRPWIAKAWWEVCGELCEAHLTAGTYVKSIENWRQMAYYVSKYVAKENNFSEPFWGHWWGYINKSGLPFVKPDISIISDRDAIKLLRYAKRKAHVKRNLTSLTVLTENPAFWADRLEDILK